MKSERNDNMPINDETMAQKTDMAARNNDYTILHNTRHTEQNPTEHDKKLNAKQGICAEP
jgi:hypothetical protein